MGDESEPIIQVDHVKYRKAGDGRSPTGRLSVFREYVEWRDNASPEVFICKFIRINGQRVSPPHKSKVQLQLILQNDEQATFVFLKPKASKEELVKEREDVKEALQKALVAHRAHVNELAKSVESKSELVELQAKQRMLREDRNFEKLYQNLVATKLISTKDFWEDHYKKEGVSEDKIGINGAFLANIVQQEGTNGVRLNLNPEIIQAIFTTYPAVEKKHLELVPHEMPETTFWTKFFQSHYFHREKEVLPNPKDPFAECVREDDEEMTKLTGEEIKRKRFDLEHLDDYALRDFVHKTESMPKSAKQTLIKRCNYLSEKILTTSWKSVGPVSSSANQKKGFGVLDRVVAETESRLESEDLAEKEGGEELQFVRIDSSVAAEEAVYSPREVNAYKSAVSSFFQSNPPSKILDQREMIFDQEEIEAIERQEALKEEKNGAPPPEEWCQTMADLTKVRDIHNAVREICRQFWGSFPPVSAEKEEKLERMAAALEKYKEDKLTKNGGVDPKNLEHCIEMVDLALQKYQSYVSFKKRKL